jgi:Mg/Co/Ni transporter MgtE
MDTDQHLVNQFFLEHPDEALQYIEELEIIEIAELLETLAPDQCTIILSRLPVYKTGKVIEKVKVDRACELIELLTTKSSQAILLVTDKSVRDQIIMGISKEKASYLRRALKYPNDRVGAHVEPFVLTLPKSINIEKALSLINASMAIIKPHIFVLDGEGKLAGYVELNSIITAEPTTKIQTILKIVKKPAFADMNAVDLLEHWDNAFIDLPVINVHGLFIGTVSRVSISELKGGKIRIDNSAVKAGNALGNLYLIGLTSLLGSPADSGKKM